MTLAEPQLTPAGPSALNDVLTLAEGEVQQRRAPEEQADTAAEEPQAEHEQQEAASDAVQQSLQA